MKRKLLQAALSLGSAAGSAMILYAFFPGWVVGFLMMVVSAHEFGHFFSAWLLGAEPSLPIFIPLGILVLGAVRVPNQTPEIGQFVSLAGPMAGAACAFALAILSLFAGFMPGVLTALWFLAWEMFSMSMGSDGKKFRRWRREYTDSHTSFQSAYAN